jgi:general secretion pathway protein C
METVLRRYGWAVMAAVIVATAYFVAAAVDDWILRRLASGVDLSQLGPAGISADGGAIDGYGQPAPAVSVDELMAGNLFEIPDEIPDAGEPEDAEEVVEVEETGPARPRSLVVVPCPAGMKLVALVAGPEAAPELGFATIEREGSSAEYRMGYEVGSYQVDRITWNRVYLAPTAPGDLCFLDIRYPDLASAQGSQPASQEPATVAVAPEATPAAPSTEGQSREERFRNAVSTSIEQVSETERNIQRSLINTVLDNQDIAMRQARVMPHEDGGNIVGFKVYGIRRDSLFGALGLENGDLIESINGIPMTGADKALQAYGRLRMADRISISVTRRGQRMNMDYNIR